MSESETSITGQQKIRTEPILAMAALASGAALVISIIFGAPLGLMLALLLIAAVVTVAFKWAKTDRNQRPMLRAQMATGAVAGVVATIAYDLTRALLTELGQLQFYPFETFNIFGQLIIGETAPRLVAFVVGTLYHLLNGVAFAVSYCFLLGGRHWTNGILWAFGLEAAMLTIYPGWLELDAVMQEFVTVSVLGHIAYGVVLGLISERKLSNIKRDQLEAERTGRNKK